MAVINGGAGDDDLTGGADADQINGGGGGDHLTGGPGGDTLRGGAGDDYLTAGDRYGVDADDDVLFGDDGDDMLISYGGFDTFSGGAGDDDLRFYNDARDVRGVADGGDGLDWLFVDFAGRAQGLQRLTNGDVTSGGQTLVVVRDIERLSLQGSKAADLVHGEEGGDSLDGKEGNDEIHGLAGNDTLEGGAGDDHLFGGDGDDHLDGYLSTGFDILDGGAGDDVLYSASRPGVLIGGAGIDHAVVDIFNDGDFVAYGQADFSVDLSAGSGWVYRDGVAVVELREIETLDFEARDGDDILKGGAYDDALTGHGGNDILIGGGGDDHLTSGSGFDQLDGGDGDDWMTTFAKTGTQDVRGGAGADFIGDDVYRSGSLWRGTLDGGSGADTVIAYVDDVGEALVGVTVGATVTLTGKVSGKAYLTVSNFETMVLNLSATGDNTYDGGAGNDEIGGGAGNDVFRLGGGADKAFTGAGDDWIEAGGSLYGDGGAGDDHVQGGTGGVWFYGRTGNDTLLGGAGENQIYGDEGDDVIRGGSAKDRLDGGAGIDTLLVVGARRDFTVQATNGSGSIVRVGSSAIDDFGRFEYIQFDDVRLSLTGQVGGVVTGGAGAESLAGATGNDLIIGGGGGDTLTGGAGADVFKYLAAADSRPDAYDIVTDFTTGSDVLDLKGVTPSEVSLVRSGGTTFVFVNTPGGAMTIAATGEVNGLDVLTHDGHGVYMIGDGAANTLVGGATGDVIQAGDGDDVIVGGAGGDVLFGQAGADVFKYLAASDSNAAGSDGLYGFETGIDKVDLTAVGATEISLIRGGGSTFLFAATPGGAMQLATVGADLNAGDLVTGLSRGIFMIGDETANSLTGAGLNDVIQAGAGADTVRGGGGGDALWGGAGADVFKYGAASDSGPAASDSIFDFQAGVDKLDLTGARTGAGDVYGVLASGGSTFVFVDLGGNGTNDMTLQLTGTAALQAGDILF